MGGHVDHHITPQFLLRPWAEDDAEKKLHAFLYRGGQLRKQRIAPKGTSYRADLYAFTREQVAGHDRQAVETKVLQDMDDRAARVRSKMVGGEALTRDDMMAWTRFLIGLRARQPQTVAHLRQEVPKLVRRSLAERPEEFEAVANGAAPSLEAWTETRLPGLIENFGLMMLGNVASHAPLADQIVRLKWITRRFPDPANALLLADNPEFVGSTIGSADFVIALPIAPDQAFFAVATDLAARQLAAAPADDLASRLNAQSIRLASEKVYATSWKDEVFIQDRLETFGEINLMPFRSADDMQGGPPA